MSNNHVRNLNPRFSQLTSELDSSAVRLEYNEFSDTLYLYALPGEQPLVSVPLDVEDTSLLVDPETEEVQGFQIDGYLSVAVIRSPQLLEIAELAGIEPAQIAAARERIGEDRRRSAAIANTLAELLRGAGLSSTRPE